MKVLAGQKVSYDVSYLEMITRPIFNWPKSKIFKKVCVVESSEISSGTFLQLYEKVGRQYEWTDQFLCKRSKVDSFITSKKVNFYQMLVNNDISGFFVLDFRVCKVCDLSYFGLLPIYIGKGLGSYMLRYAILTAWGQDIEKMTVNTNTLDHRNALPLYKKYGFTTIRVEKHERILSNDKETDGRFALVE